jgi:hypothetical protein
MQAARSCPACLARVDGKSPVEYISKFKPEAPVATMQMHVIFRKQIVSTAEQ